MAMMMILMMIMMILFKEMAAFQVVFITLCLYAIVKNLEGTTMIFYLLLFIFIFLINIVRISPTKHFWIERDLNELLPLDKVTKVLHWWVSTMYSYFSIVSRPFSARGQYSFSRREGLETLNKTKQKVDKISRIFEDSFLIFFHTLQFFSQRSSTVFFLFLCIFFLFAFIVCFVVCLFIVCFLFFFFVFSVQINSIYSIQCNSI
jgi:hypothetical protein